MSLYYNIFVIYLNMKDVEKVKQIQIWNKEVFSILYEDYVDEIYKFIYLKTLDVEKSEDLTSETFISALKNISNFDTENPESNFKAWIYKIAYNKVINFYKTKDREVEFSDNLDLSFETDFWKNLDNKEKLKNILNYLGTLKKQEREIIIYRIWYDLSFSEIAEVLWISTENCRKISSRTMKKISANFLALFFIFLIF